MRKIFLLSILCMFAYIVNAQENRALQITGDGSFFESTDIPNDVTLTYLTIEGWVKLDKDAAVDEYTALVDIRADNARALIFKPNGDDVTMSYEWNGDWLYIGEDNIVPVDEWVHLAVVINAEDKITDFYINGEFIASDESYTLDSDIALGNSFRVGISIGASDPIRTLIGVMDEIRIWDVARTEEEINENMEIEIDPDTEGLLIYYNCNEEDNSDVLTDVTGNGYDLFAVGADYEFVDDTEWYVEPPASIKNTKNVEISTFPNPVQNILNFKGLDLVNSTIQVFDITGHLVQETVVNSSAIDISGFESGIYLYTIKEGVNTYNGKFVKE